MREAAVVKCDSCGADMLFDPEKGALYCPYCNSTKRIEKSVPISRDFYTERADGDVYAGDSVSHCPNCGGDVELQNFAVAVKCPFCGATNIEKREDMKGLKPDSILPFSYSREKALAAGKKWLKKKIFSPYGLKKNFKADNFNGLYFPVFTFSADTFSSYRGRLGEYRTRVVGSGKNRRVETYTYWYNVSGNISLNFSEIPEEASARLEQEELKKISPFDIESAESYKREYLAGFLAERYSQPLDTSFQRAKSTMDDRIRSAIIGRYRADVVGQLNVYTDYNRVRFRYMMLPMWVCNYRFKNKPYRFIVNGRNGKATGRAPLSAIRITLTALFGAGIIALMVWLVAFSGLLQ